MTAMILKACQELTKVIFYKHAVDIFPRIHTLLIPSKNFLWRPNQEGKLDKTMPSTSFCPLSSLLPSYRVTYKLMGEALHYF